MPQALTLLLSISQKYCRYFTVVVYECMIVHAALELKVPSLLQHEDYKVRRKCVAMKFSQPDVLKLVSAEFLHDSEPASARRQYLISVVPTRLIFFYYKPTTFILSSKPQRHLSLLAIHSLFISNHVVLTGQLNSKPFAWRDKTRPLLQNFPLFHLAVWPSRHPLFAIIQSIRHHRSITLVTQPVPFSKPPFQPLSFGRNPCLNVGRCNVEELDKLVVRHT